MVWRRRPTRQVWRSGEGNNSRDRFLRGRRRGRRGRRRNWQRGHRRGRERTEKSTTIRAGVKSGKISVSTNVLNDGIKVQLLGASIGEVRARVEGSAFVTGTTVTASKEATAAKEVGQASRATRRGSVPRGSRARRRGIQEIVRVCKELMRRSEESMEGCRDGKTKLTGTMNASADKGSSAMVKSACQSTGKDAGKFGNKMSWTRTEMGDECAVGQMGQTSNTSDGSRSMLDLSKRTNDRLVARSGTPRAGGNVEGEELETGSNGCGKSVRQTKWHIKCWAIGRR